MRSISSRQLNHMSITAIAFWLQLKVQALSTRSESDILTFEPCSLTGANAFMQTRNRGTICRVGDGSAALNWTRVYNWWLAVSS